MANITDTSSFDDVYLLDVGDAAKGGLTGKANIQAIALANRTRFLKNKIDAIEAQIKKVVNYSGSQTVASGGNLNCDGSAYTLAFPLGSPDYTTPNDGITRYYKITASCLATTLTITSGNAQMAVYTITSGPTYQLLVNMPFRVALTAMCCSKIIQLAPNTKIKALLGNNSTGANMTVSDMQLIIEEWIPTP